MTCRSRSNLGSTTSSATWRHSAASTAMSRPSFRVRCASSAMPASTSARWTASLSRPTATEEDLRERLRAPADNLTQDLYIADGLKTGRVMVKDEDVCLHCGLCAERCPTGAWDMQKFLLDMAQAGPACRTSDSQHERLRRQIRQRQRLRLGQRQPALRQSRSCAWACRSARATSSPPTSRACPPGTRCGSREAGYLGRRGGVDLMVAMNPQTWEQDVAEIEPGGYLFYDSTKPMPAVEVPRRHHGDRRAADRDLPTATTPTRASASCSRTSSMSASLSALLDIDVAEIEKLIGEQFRARTS